MESIGQLTAKAFGNRGSQSLFLVSSTTMRMVAITCWECRAQAVAESAVASNYGHAPGRDGCRRNNLDIQGDAPSFGQAHAGLFVLGVRAIHDEAFEPIGHDLVALLNVDREAADTGHEYARTPRDIRSDIPGAASGSERDLRDLIHVLDPFVLVFLDGLDGGRTDIPHMSYTVRHPIDVLFDGLDHARQYGRAAWTGDCKKVGKACRRHAQIGPRSRLPFLSQR